MPTMVARSRTNWVGYITIGVVVAASGILAFAALSGSSKRHAPVAPEPQTVLRPSISREGAPALEAVSIESGSQDDLSALRDENAALRAALEQAQADSDRYRKGLEQAVAELNKGGGSAAPQTFVITPPKAAKPRPQGALHSIRGPRVIPMGDKVLVDGLLYNAGAGDISATIDLVLYANGREEDRSSIDVDLGPGQEHPYLFEFRARFSSATYTASLVF